MTDTLSHPPRPPALQLTGSATLLPHMQRIAEAYMASHRERIVINGGCGSMRGYKALLDGTTDIAMASGVAPRDLVAAAATRGHMFHDTLIARDAILPLVHASNPIETLTRRQLRDVFTGRIADWRHFGGPDGAIEVLLGPPAGGVSSSWRAEIFGDDDTYSPLARVMPARERVARVAAHPFAITYVAQMATASPMLKALRVDGVAAGPASGTTARQIPDAYPLRAPMLLVTLGAPAPAAARFIAYAAAHGASDAAGDAS